MILAEPLEHYGEQALWRAVITQALQDAASKSPKPEALYEKSQAIWWLTECTKDFATVCDYADMNPYFVRAESKKALKRHCKWRKEPNEA